MNFCFICGGRFPVTDLLDTGEIDEYERIIMVCCECANDDEDYY